MISVVIVNFFKAEKVIEAIESLGRQTSARTFQIAVVDNSVSPAEEKILRDRVGPDVRLAFPQRNLGYSKGVNLAVQMLASGNHVLLVNPDIVVEDTKTVETLVEELENHPRIGLLASMQRNHDGSIVEVARTFPSAVRLILRRLCPGRFEDLHLLTPLMNSSDPALIDVDWVQSSFTLVRDTFWQEIGGLNERYFVFMSDVDLGRQALRRGLRVSVTSATTVWADGLRASRGGIFSVFRSAVVRIHIRDAFRYFLDDFLYGTEKTAPRKHY